MILSGVNVKFTVNGNTEQLEQYYRLREKCFRSDLGLQEFDGSEDEGDRDSQILLAFMGDECVAGIRISPHTTLQSQIDLLNLKSVNCCMWERFVIDPAMRSVEFFAQFCLQLVEVTRQFGYDNAMVLSSLKNARFYRRCHSAMGIDFHIHRQVPHCAEGVFAGLEHYLSVAYLEQAEPQSVQVAV